MAKISNVTARTFCAHINNSLVYSLITLCFHSSLLMGQSCLPSCIFFFFFHQRLPKSQPREAVPFPLTGMVPVVVSTGTGGWPTAIRVLHLPFQHSPTPSSCWPLFSSSCSCCLRPSVPTCFQQCSQIVSQHLFFLFNAEEGSYRMLIKMPEK